MHPFSRCGREIVPQVTNEGATPGSPVRQGVAAGRLAGKLNDTAPAMRSPSLYPFNKPHDAWHALTAFGGPSLGGP